MLSPHNMYNLYEKYRCVLDKEKGKNKLRKPRKKQKTKNENENTKETKENQGKPLQIVKND